MNTYVDRISALALNMNKLCQLIGCVYLIKEGHGLKSKHSLLHLSNLLRVFMLLENGEGKNTETFLLFMSKDCLSPS